MKAAKDVFYALAQQVGHHQFLEFAGFMHEYIKICEQHMEAGGNFAEDSVLQLKDYNADYIADKLDCIYGPSLRARPEFVAKLATPENAARWLMAMPPKPDDISRTRLESLLA